MLHVPEKQKLNWVIINEIPADKKIKFSWVIKKNARVICLLGSSVIRLGLCFNMPDMFWQLVTICTIVTIDSMNFIALTRVIWSTGKTYSELRLLESESRYNMKSKHIF